MVVRTRELPWPDFQVCCMPLPRAAARRRFDTQVLIALENQPTTGSFQALHLLHLVLKQSASYQGSGSKPCSKDHLKVKFTPDLSSFKQKEVLRIELPAQK